MKRLFILLCAVCTLSVYAAEQITIAQFIANADETTTYRLRGEVKNITNNSYGNFDLKDETGSLYIHGLKNENGDNVFSSKGIAEGDTITLEGIYLLYNGVKPEIVNALYISHKKPDVVWTPVPVTISEFIALNDGKRYILTGVVTDITDTYYNNFYMEDETGSAYVYGLWDTNNNKLNIGTMGLAEGDTITLSAVYKLYGAVHEAINAQYISHKKPGGTDPDPDPNPEGSVTFSKAFAGSDGWSKMVGQTVTFSNDFYLCDTYSNAYGYIVADHRLRSPEEYGEEGTTAYKNAVEANTHDSCRLSGVTFTGNFRPGAIIRGLEAEVVAEHQLRAVNVPKIIYNELPTQRPDLGSPSLVVCAANIENFFVTLGGYAGAKNETQLEVQKQKISKALYNMDADIYALAEVEQGPNAIKVLVDLLNGLAGTEQYAYVDNGSSYYDGTMVCYIYRKDKVKPYGNYLFPCTYAAMKWREAIQCFEQLSNGERFNLSVNHFFAKISKTDADRQDNMKSLINKLAAALTYDPDVLVMGDLNGYTGEESNLLLKRDKGYVDLLMKYDPQGYSHIYNQQVGYLDHAYCTPSLATQVTKAASYHLNADTKKNSYNYASGDASMYRYADHEPILVGLRLGETVPDPDPDPRQDVDNVQGATQAYKQIINGTLYIIYNNNRYTVTGVRVE